MSIFILSDASMQPLPFQIQFWCKTKGTVLLVLSTSKLAQSIKHTHYNRNSQSHFNPISPSFMNKSLTVLHQNIRGVRGKTSELLASLLPNLPHVIYLTEHHLREQEIENLSIAHYTFGAKFCRQYLKEGGTGIFVHESLAFTNIYLKNSCIEQHIETCTIKINLPATYIYIIIIYRSPTGNFATFIKRIDTILNQLYKPNIEIMICGDINVNYLDEKCNKRQQLDALFATYNLISMVLFPTRSLNGSVSATDNIFIDISHSGKYTLHPLINGLSDHDGQIIKLENISMHKQSHETRTIRNFNKSCINDFKTKLSYEIGDNIFGKNDVNTIFNNFHNTFLRIFFQAFPKRKQTFPKKTAYG
jgi:exonuclease III